jgi:transposase
MQMIYRVCAAGDVHKKTITTCLRKTTETGEVIEDVRTCKTTTSELLAMHDWLVAEGCEAFAIESTGVYWKPVFNLLEGSMKVILVNPYHFKALPGRKTDVQDAEWMAELLQHGLLRASFIPQREIRELRELVRTRTTLIRDRAREVNRVQKVLETANIKLSSVATDVLGVSGRAMLKQMVDGESRPEVLAELARGRMRSKREDLREALHGRMTDHHRFLLRGHLEHIEFLEKSIAKYTERIEACMAPFAMARECLTQVTGIGPEVATVVISEMGPDMSAWATDRHAASWVGICPGNNESAGKRKSGKTRKGNPWLRRALVQAAWAASHTHHTYLSAQFHRLRSRRGPRKAVVAVAHSILIRAYHLLKEGTEYQELGASYFDERDRERVQRRLIRRLEELGLKVRVEPMVA